MSIQENNCNLYLNNLPKLGNYSAQEIIGIYELGRLYLESGDIYRAEAIFTGLTVVVPQFALSWLGLICIHFQSGNFEHALESAKQAYKLNPESIEITLYLACCCLTVADYNAAGIYLGEVTDKIEAGVTISPNLMRFYRLQITRFQIMA